MALGDDPVEVCWSIQLFFHGLLCLPLAFAELLLAVAVILPNEQVLDGLLHPHVSRANGIFGRGRHVEFRDESS